LLSFSGYLLTGEEEFAIVIDSSNACSTGVTDTCNACFVGTSDIGQAPKVSNQEKMFDEEKKMTSESTWHCRFMENFMQGVSFYLKLAAITCRSRIRYSLGLFWEVESFSSTVLTSNIRIHIIL
jgi:hypothetical protein